MFLAADRGQIWHQKTREYQIVNHGVSIGNSRTVPRPVDPPGKVLRHCQASNGRSLCTTQICPGSLVAAFDLRDYVEQAVSFEVLDRFSEIQSKDSGMRYRQVIQATWRRGPLEQLFWVRGLTT